MSFEKKKNTRKTDIKKKIPERLIKKKKVNVTYNFFSYSQTQAWIKCTLRNTTQ